MILFGTNRNLQFYNIESFLLQAKYAKEIPGKK